jgi:DNA-binding IclR family transcriptional regulator
MPAKDAASAENQSVARALRILHLLAERQVALGVREIARQLDVAPSIAQRLISTMANAGFVEQTGANLRYSIGYKAFQVGNAFIGRNNLHSAVMPELYALADQHINGFLGVRRDRSVVYLATVPSSGPIAITHRPGAETHLHSTALGKALLAEMPDPEVRALLAQEPLTKLTPKTKISVTHLVAELEDVRRLGYAINDEENREGLYSAGAVVRDSSGHAVAALSGSVPSPGLGNRDRARIIELVLDAAQRASRKLGAPDIDRSPGGSRPRRANPSTARHPASPVDRP